MNYKSYETYKDSNMKWVDEIPKDWKIDKVKHILKNRNESNDPIKSKNILSLTASKGVIPYNEKGDIGNKAKEDLSSYKLAYPNDIVMNSMNAIIGSINICNYFGCVSPVYYMFYSDSEDININYYNYIFQTKPFQSSLKGLGNGILDFRMRIPLDKFNQVLLPIPNIETQDSIVNFLNNKVKLIESKIEKNTELINLLEEKKIALINQVVTKGLNNHVPMKYSGIEWIGEIPEHWEVKKIKEISSVKPSNVDKKSKDGEPEVLLCNYTDVYNNDFITNDLDFMKATASYDQISKLSLNKGDIIITKDSETAEDIGVPTIVTEDLDNVVCGYHLTVIRPYESIYNKFLFRCFESKKINDQFVIAANGITRFGLSLYPIANSYVCIPPYDEQKELSVFLEKEISKIYKIMKSIQKEITLLEEYKASLIHHVVTGKIDVRDEV